MSLLGGCKYKLSCCKFCIYTHPVNSKFTTWQKYKVELHSMSTYDPFFWEQLTFCIKADIFWLTLPFYYHFKLWTGSNFPLSSILIKSLRIVRLWNFAPKTVTNSQTPNPSVFWLLNLIIPVPQSWLSLWKLLDCEILHQKLFSFLSTFGPEQKLVDSFFTFIDHCIHGANSCP